MLRGGFSHPRYRLRAQHPVAWGCPDAAGTQLVAVVVVVSPSQCGAGGGWSWTGRSRKPTSCTCWMGWRWSTGTRGSRWRGPSCTWRRVRTASGCGRAPPAWLRWVVWEKCQLGEVILWQLGAAKLLPGWPRGLQGSFLLTTASLGASPGVFGDCDNEGDVLRWSRHNSFLLYQLGTFTAFLELLHMEIE